MDKMEKMRRLEWNLEKYEYWKKDLVEKAYVPGSLNMRREDIDSQIDLIIDLYMQSMEMIKEIAEDEV